MSKRVAEREPTYSKGLRYAFPPPLDVATLPLIWQKALSLDVKGRALGHRMTMITML